MGNANKTVKQTDPKIVAIREAIKEGKLKSAETWTAWNLATRLSIRNCLDNRHSNCMIEEVYFGMLDAHMENVAAKFKIACRQCVAMDLDRDSKGKVKGLKDKDYWLVISSDNSYKEAFTILDVKGLQGFKTPKGSKGKKNDTSASSSKYEVVGKEVGILIKEMELLAPKDEEIQRQVVLFYSEMEMIRDRLQSRIKSIQDNQERLSGLARHEVTNEDEEVTPATPDNLEEEEEENIPPFEGDESTDPTPEEVEQEQAARKEKIRVKRERKAKEDEEQLRAKRDRGMKKKKAMADALAKFEEEHPVDKAA